MYSEDEDLRRAIEMSLASTNQGKEDTTRATRDESSGLTINGPHFVDYDVDSFDERGIGACDRSDLRTDPHTSVTLPPELRHLLASNNRTGAHV